MEPVVEIKNISKTYKGADEKSLNSISFSINKGDKIGVFGPNGAGKTTLMSIICGIFKPTHGDVLYRSQGEFVDLKSMLFKIGYVPQDFSFYEELTPFQNLMYFGSLYSIPKNELKQKIEDLLSVLGLGHVIHKKVVEFSGGMKRRVNLAIGIINEPELLFLDEPTVGVDVQSKNAILTYLEKLNKNGTTIIYTSHHLNEAQVFCNRIVLIDKGNLIESNTLDNLLNEHKENNLESLFLKLTGIEYRD